MHEIHSSNPPVVTGIFDPNKSQARHHCRFVLKTKYETDKSGLEKKISNADKKIPDTSRLFKKTDYNSKVSEIESKIPSISGLATTFALTKVENEIPNVGNLVKKKTDYNTKISHIESRYITTTDYSKLSEDIINNNIKSKGLVNKNDFAGSINNTNLGKKKVATLATKSELKADQDKMLKLQEFDSVLLLVKVTLIMMDHNF